MVYRVQFLDQVKNGVPRWANMDGPTKEDGPTKVHGLLSRSSTILDLVFHSDASIMGRRFFHGAII